MQIIHKGMAVAALSLCLALVLPLASEAEAGAVQMHHRALQPEDDSGEDTSEQSVEVPVDPASGESTVPSDPDAEATAAAEEAVADAEASGPVAAAAPAEGSAKPLAAAEGPKAPLSMVASQQSNVAAKQVVQQLAAPSPAAMASQAGVDAANAREAAATAKQAATVANKVAEHSIKITGHAQSALKHALGALHDARVETTGLDNGQKESLKKAEAKLREATKTADYGALKKNKDASDLKKEKMEAELSKSKKTKTELEQMRSDVKELREKLKAKGGDEDVDKALADLEEELAELEKNGGGDAASNDELKAEIERLREQIDKLEDNEGSVKYEIPAEKGKKKHSLPKVKGAASDDEELMRDVKMKPLGEAKGEGEDEASQEVTPVQEKGIDIDTAMPYGDLEPFGREDTAQELTESSVRESDEMVDQLERAEVAEEKRAVFRALTRLRGAAITSFDGVARSQTGNIDEYNKIHKWRKTHPLHHLADEESDITKWAFPDNAD